MTDSQQLVSLQPSSTTPTDSAIHPQIEVKATKGPSVARILAKPHTYREQTQTENSWWWSPFFTETPCSPWPAPSKKELASKIIQVLAAVLPSCSKGFQIDTWSRRLKFERNPLWWENLTKHHQNTNIWGTLRMSSSKCTSTSAPLGAKAAKGRIYEVDTWSSQNR